MTRFIILIIIATTLACSTPQNDVTTEAVETIPTNTIASSYATKDTITLVASGLTMADIAFDKKEIRTSANLPITIALKNISTDKSMPHNVVIIQSGTANPVGQNGVQFKENGYINPADKNVIAHSPLAEAETTIYFSFKAPPAGEYEFICSYPGHWGLMKGKFITE